MDAFKETKEIWWGVTPGMECRYNHENQEHRTLNIDGDGMSVLPVL